MKYIPYGHQDITTEDIQAVVRVLQSDFLTQGPVIEQFERMVAEYCGAQFAVAVSNATAALHIACAALGVEKGDVIWTVPNTFVASANCALYCQAAVDFVDIDSQTYNMSITALKRKLQEAKARNSLPKVVIPVHFSGQSCEMEEIALLARQYGFYIVEDASHAIGGSYQNGKIGGCAYSDMTVFSFHPVKIVTTGEGGMILTNNKELKQNLLQLRSHGITRDRNVMTEAANNEGSWYYQQIALGFNYRMTDIQAALGVSQMQRIDEFVAKRKKMARHYDEKLSDLPLILPYQHQDTLSAWHLYVVQIDPKKTDRTRRQIFEFLKEKQIGVNVHYIPVHMQPFYAELGFKKGDFPRAEAYYEQIITLPLYFGLTEEEQDYVIDCLHSLEW